MVPLKQCQCQSERREEEPAREVPVLWATVVVDPEVVLRVAGKGYPMPVLDPRGTLILNGYFELGFKTKPQYKDLGITLAAALDAYWNALLLALDIRVVNRLTSIGDFVHGGKLHIASRSTLGND